MDGTAICNFSQKGLADGLYLAVGEEETFYLCLPQVDASGELLSSMVSFSLVDRREDAFWSCGEDGMSKSAQKEWK